MIRTKNTVLKKVWVVSKPTLIPQGKLVNSLVVVHKRHRGFGSNAHDGVVENRS